VIGVPDEKMARRSWPASSSRKGEGHGRRAQGIRADPHGKQKTPKYVDFVTEFPMNAAGKILKYKMRQDAIEKLGLQKAASIETA